MAEAFGFQALRTDLTLHGHLDDGRAVTLFDCVRQPAGGNIGGPARYHFVTAEVWIGGTFEDRRVAAFSTARVWVHGLIDWLDLKPIQVEAAGYADGMKLRLTPPEQITVSMEDGWTVRFCYSWSPPGFPMREEVIIRQNAFIEIVPDRSASAGELLHAATRVKNFLAFGANAPVTISKLRYRLAGQDEGGFDKGRGWVDVFRSIDSGASYDGRISWPEMLFDRALLAESLPDILCQWMRFHASFDVSLALLGAARRSETLEGQFLFTAQSLEALHRSKGRSDLMPVGEFDAILSCLRRACPPDRRDWLSQRLRFANELGLRGRIKNLMQPISGRFGNAKARKRFVSLFVDTRNYLTHYPEELKPRAAQGELLWRLAMKSEALLKVSILLSTGFTDAQIELVLNRCGTLRQSLAIDLPKET